MIKKYITKDEIIMRHIYIVIFLFFTFLFYAQSVQLNGLYISDLLLHIQFGIDLGNNSYSIVFLIFRILYNISGNTILIAIFLSTIVVVTILFTYRLLLYLIGEGNKLLIYFGALVCNFVMAIYLPFVSEFRYISNIGPTLIHNSTYICMKLLGLIAILYFLKIMNIYLKKLMFNQWLFFALILTLTNLVKPNFIMTFSLTIFLELVYDLFKSKGKGIKQIIILGMSVLLSLAVLLLQYKILFVDNTSGGGLGINFGYALTQWSQYPIVSILQSLAFPLFVLIFNLKELVNDRNYRVLNTTALIAFIQYLGLIETGIRMGSLNFVWGYAMGIFMLFIGSTYKIHQNIFNKRIFVSDKLNKVYYGISFLLLFLHLISGLTYLKMIVLGGSYL